MPGILAACVLVAALVAVPPAPAGTVERDEVDSADVSFLAGPGEANRVVVREDAAGVHFSDPGALLTTRTCLSLGPHEVLCPGLSETLVVETGDGDDTIDVAAAPTAFAVGGDGDDAIVAARGSGGPGNDVLRGLATGGDLHGGPGDDTVLGGRAGT